MKIRDGLESNWNWVKIRSIQFVIQLIRKSKNIRKIDRKLIHIRLVQFDSNYRVESNFDKLNWFKIRLI